MSLHKLYYHKIIQMIIYQLFTITAEQKGFIFIIVENSQGIYYNWLHITTILSFFLQINFRFKSIIIL